MNRLSLERRVYVYEPQPGWPGSAEIVVPIIDGTPLYEMVEGRNVGLDIEFLVPPSRQWLGGPSYDVHGHAVILDGGCGVAECCGVYAHITLDDDRVIWSRFGAGGFPPLPDRLHFEFDRTQYETVIADVMEAPERRWHWRDTTSEDLD